MLLRKRAKMLRFAGPSN